MVTRAPNLFNGEGFRSAARRRLPRAIFDYIDGGADDELTVRRNREDFESIELMTRVLVDVSMRSLATTVCGIHLDLPLLIAPTGLAGVIHSDGELGGLTAALRHGTNLILSTGATYSVEELTTSTGSAPWFQLYPTSDRGVREKLLSRAVEAGCPAVVVTVDCPVTGHRERDLANRAVLPPKPSLANILDFAQHPGWVVGAVQGRRVTMKNLVPEATTRHAVAIAKMSLQLFDPSLAWEDLTWIRERWTGPLLVKGILNPMDAKEAVDRGANGIIVSNHGGRQLDGAVSSIRALGPVVDAVGDRCDVLIDGGIRRGIDVVKALALGARACLIGRPWLYGLAAGGTTGVDKVLDLFEDEIHRALALLGLVRTADIDHHCISEARATAPPSFSGG